MGYTHYFQRETIQPLPEGQWEDFKALVSQALHPDILPTVSETAGGYFNDVPLKFDSWFSGDGNELVLEGLPEELNHETLVIHFETGPSSSWFCKTARKPYDFAVCVVLSLLKIKFGNHWSIGTDGTQEDWEPAFEHIRTHLRRTWRVSPLCIVDGELQVKNNQVYPPVDQVRIWMEELVESLKDNQVRPFDAKPDWSEVPDGMALYTSVDGSVWMVSLGDALVDHSNPAKYPFLEFRPQE